MSANYPEPDHGPEGMGFALALVLFIPIWAVIICSLVWWFS